MDMYTWLLKINCALFLDWQKQHIRENSINTVCIPKASDFLTRVMDLYTE